MPDRPPIVFRAQRSGALRFLNDALRRAPGALRRFAAALNEPDEDYRKELLRRSLTNDAKITWEGRVVVADINRLSQLIQNSLETDDAYSFRLLGMIRAYTVVGQDGDHADSRHVRASCRITGRDGDGERSIVAVLTANGTLRSIDVGQTGQKRTRTLTERLVHGLSSSPLAAIGVLGGLLYFALRLPSGVFYGKLGTTPEEVGLGPEVLVPQSITWLVYFLVVMLALGFFVLIAMPAFEVGGAIERLWRLRHRWSAVCAGVTYVEVFFAALIANVYLSAQIAGDRSITLLIVGFWIISAVPLAAWVGALSAMWLVPSVVPHWDVVRELGRRRRVEIARRRDTGVLIAGFSVVVLLGLPLWASIDADYVKEGVVSAGSEGPASEGNASGRYLPWRALPAYVTWAPNTEAQPLKNTCEALRLLGVANGQFILYDNTRDVVFRVPVRVGAVASAPTVAACRKLTRRTRVQSR